MKSIFSIQNGISFFQLLLVCKFTTVYGATESALRINGRVSLVHLDDDLKPYGETNGMYRFQIDVSQNGRWLMQCSDVNDEHRRSAVGYNGTNLLEVRYVSGPVVDLENPKNSYSIPVGSGPMILSIREGYDYPYGIEPPFSFVWYAIIGSHYWNKKPNLLRPPQPLDNSQFIRAYTVTSQPEYHDQWPYILKNSVLFTEFINIPEYPPGVPLITDEENHSNHQKNALEFSKRRKSDVQVGSIKSSSEKQFGRWSFPTEFIGELSNYAGDGYQKLDQIWIVSKATVETVVEIDAVYGIPEFDNGRVQVRDYRFRKVDESSKVQYLSYDLKDQIIPAKDNPNTLARFELEIAESTKRHGKSFISRGAFKSVIVFVLLTVFLTPIVKIIRNKFSVKK